ncbi:3-keto-5-aminohexanoate cleavage protein [uncultured Shimia sp.]|uniref:3-keto-5-aminohexanoate cleavage protein n=1 Tax=uncultured Shimia sp. TaxID=573152 RepID=UPI002616BF2F|nr:3-keto-5-aminohexanoate cleavage protein [uncultured Shimia sp.]
MPKDSITSDQKPEDLQPLKVTVAPNGARKTTRDHPELPTTIDDIAAAARKCADAGAHELHLHVRNAGGKHSLDPGLYREAMSAVSETAPDFRIQITTEAAGIYSVGAQFETLKQLAPTAASVSVREMARDVDIARYVYRFAHDGGTHIQHILYDQNDIFTYRAWLAEGFIEPTQQDVLLVLGQYASPNSAQIQTLPHMLAALNGEMSSWTVCAFGPTEQQVMRAVLRMNGHVRVGFENNLYRENGTLLRDNTESVSLVVQHAMRLGRPLCKKVHVS